MAYTVLEVESDVGCVKHHAEMYRRNAGKWRGWKKLIRLAVSSPTQEPGRSNGHWGRC